MPKFTRNDKTEYYAADKERDDYPKPPFRNTEYRDIPVGLLNHNFATYSGPQRDRPEDKVSKKTGNSIYRKSLFSRSRAYGQFSWSVLRARVVSERPNGVLYVLDGNSSNHWLERVFGPSFQVPCQVLTGLSLKDEKDIFLKLQEIKKVTPTEKYRVDVDYDEGSLSALIKGVVEVLGFEIAQRTTDPYAIGRTTCEWIVRKFGATGTQAGLNALRHTLETVTALFPENDPKRTNGALVKALAVVLYNDDEFNGVSRAEVLNFIRASGADKIVGQSRGGSGEAEVLGRLHDALGY